MPGYTTYFKREWVTTGAVPPWSNHFPEPCEVPVPEGDGWRLHSVVATTGVGGGPDVLYYTWERHLMKEDDGEWVGIEPISEEK